MKAKDYLNRVKKLDRLLENKLVEIEQWKSIAMGSSASADGDRVKSSSNQQKMADAVGRYVDLQAEINAQIDGYADMKQEIIENIEKLPANEYDILHKMYIQGLELDEYAETKGKTYSWAATLHGNALKKLQVILDERNENENRIN